jgi:hypothetical protein
MGKQKVPVEKAIHFQWENKKFPWKKPYAFNGKTKSSRGKSHTLSMGNKKFPWKSHTLSMGKQKVPVENPYTLSMGKQKVPVEKAIHFQWESSRGRKIKHSCGKAIYFQWINAKL